ncbi:MAG: DedA family protein [Candidatus Aenigmarchaeota archaeon]|nr:DedA family protein [Candidatus Aenigmarchaeota archaeon]
MVEAIIQNLISNFSYLGVFLSSIITSASIIFPLPGQLVLVFAVLLKLNPLLTSLLTAVGSMIGEMTGYGVGLAGGKIAGKRFKGHKKLVKTIKRYYNKYAFLMIFATAFLFFPFDLVGIISGMSRYDVRKFLLAGFLGKFLKTLLIIYLIQNGIHLFGFA